MLPQPFRHWPMVALIAGLMISPAGCATAPQDARAAPMSPGRDGSESVSTWRQGGGLLRAGHGTQWQNGYWTNEGGTWDWIPGHST